MLLFHNGILALFVLKSGQYGCRLQIYRCKTMNFENKMLKYSHWPKEITEYIFNHQHTFVQKQTNLSDQLQQG